MDSYIGGDHVDWEFEYRHYDGCSADMVPGRGDHPGNQSCSPTTLYSYVVNILR